MTHQSALSPTDDEGVIPRLRQEFQIKRLLPSLTAGLVAGILEVLMAISYIALIFAGPLSQFTAAGIGLALFSTAILTATVAVLSSLPGSVAGTQDSPAVILALIAAAIAAAMPATATSDERFLTIIAALALSTILTGVFFLALGGFNLGGLIRFIPYPVIGGFSAGTGWLFVQGSITVMTNVHMTAAHLATVFAPEMLLRWLPGLAFAIVVVVALQRFHHFLVMPSLILAAISLFYATLWLFGISAAEAMAEGWLMGPFPEGSLWQPLSLSNLSYVHWSIIVGQVGSIATVLLVSVISLLLNASVIELAVKCDIDLNRELRVTGLANIAAGLGSGIPGYVGISSTTLGYRIGADSRLVGLTVAALAGAVLFFGPVFLAFLPRVVVGGLLLFLGLEFLIEWVYRAWSKFSWGEYLIIIAILAVVVVVGFLEGVALGLMLAMLLFVVTYSRVNMVKHTLSGANSHSLVERPRLYQHLLKKRGEQLYILELQGFLFFGTAHRLLEQVRGRLDEVDLPSPRYIVFDFRQVSGLDASAMLSFVKIKQLAQARNSVLVFTHLSPLMRQQLAGQVLTDEDPDTWQTFSDMDHGIEWCEEQMIQVFEDVGFSTQPRAVRRNLEGVLAQSESLANLFETLIPESQTQTGALDDMLPYMEQKDVETGAYLIRQGEPPTGLYFIEAGQVTVHVTGRDGHPRRLRTMGAGTVVGEMGAYLGRPASASVVTDQPSSVLYLSVERLQEIEATEPHITAAFHKFMVQLQSERLASANDTLNALLR
ncbi:MAG: SLC26A/SulP transporter family protein [Anaerolineae bacterium]|nr:SLC26A/SulP transporter family protein [Anaerolineae bacterium]